MRPSGLAGLAGKQFIQATVHEGVAGAVKHILHGQVALLNGQ